MYSIVIADKANSLNPRKCAQWLLEELPNAENPDGPAYLDSLMPRSDSVPADIGLKPKAAEEAAKMADNRHRPPTFVDEEKQKPLRVPSI